MLRARCAACSACTGRSRAGGSSLPLLHDGFERDRSARNAVRRPRPGRREHLHDRGFAVGEQAVREDPDVLDAADREHGTEVVVAVRMARFGCFEVLFEGGFRARSRFALVRAVPGGPFFLFGRRALEGGAFDRAAGGDPRLQRDLFFEHGRFGFTRVVSDFERHIFDPARAFARAGVAGHRGDERRREAERVSRAGGHGRALRPAAPFPRRRRCGSFGRRHRRKRCARFGRGRGRGGGVPDRAARRVRGHVRLGQLRDLREQLAPLSCAERRQVAALACPCPGRAEPPAALSGLCVPAAGSRAKLTSISS